MVRGDGEGAQLVLGGAGDLHPGSGPPDLQPRHGLVSVHLERIFYNVYYIKIKYIINY